MNNKFAAIFLAGAMAGTCFQGAFALDDRSGEAFKRKSGEFLDEVGSWVKKTKEKSAQGAKDAYAELEDKTAAVRKDLDEMTDKTGEKWKESQAKLSAKLNDLREDYYERMAENKDERVAEEAKLGKSMDRMTEKLEEMKAGLKDQTAEGKRGLEKSMDRLKSKKNHIAAKLAAMQKATRKAWAMARVDISRLSDEWEEAYERALKPGKRRA